MPDTNTRLVQIDASSAAMQQDPLPWAAAMLTEALAARGVTALLGDAAAGSQGVVTIRLATESTLGPAETFGIDARNLDRGTLTVRGADARGLAYGLTELADRVRFATDPIDALRAASLPPRSPAVPVRGVLRAFASDVLDRAWLCDRTFWVDYLNNLAEQRINRLHLALGMQYNYSHDFDVRDNYLCFAYPFLLEVPGWESVSVAGVSSAERAENLAALRFASGEAKRRGMHFQLGLWNHAVRPEVGDDSPNLRYRIEGLPDNHIAQYSADALGSLLRQCPAIDGVTFRVHYEGGVPEAGHGDFWRTVMGGMREVGRPLDVDMHAKGVDDELVDAARQAGGRVIVSAKYWAEHQGLPYHQAAIRALEHARPNEGDNLRGVTQNARRFTRYGYADFLRQDRDYDVLFRIWPGTQRLLLWADPDLFAGYGRTSTLGGALGVELCEPLTFRGRKDTGADAPRDLYADPELSLGIRDWTKYAYEYRLWGRLLFDPNADRETWLRQLRSEFGPASEHVEAALSAAGKVLPLVTIAVPTSASNNWFWPEVFFDMPIARGAWSAAYDFDLGAPGTWGSVSPFDPAMFECADDYARSLLSGQPSGRYTPEHVATWLERFAEAAVVALDKARTAVPDAAGPDFRRVDVDVQVQALLGRFFAGKVRCGVGYSLFRLTRDPEHLRRAIERYDVGRQALADLTKVVDGVYVADLAFGNRATERGNWLDRLGQVDADLGALRRELGEAVETTRPPTAKVRGVWSSPRGTVHCEPPARFVPGEPLEIYARASSGIELTLHIRHLDQSEAYVEVPMEPTRDGYVAGMPAQFTDSPYPIQFFLIARHASDGTAWIVPGLDDTLANEPYHVLSPA